jgi:hypothetical protein
VFKVTSGVLQGSSLCPSIFSVFINSLIVHWLKVYLVVFYAECIMAEFFIPMLLLSASVSGLQDMPNLCYNTINILALKFNPSKWI